MAGFKKIFKKFLGFEEDSNENEEIQQEQQSKINQIENQEEIKPIQEITMYPKSFADACDIIEQLELGNIVIVNMNELNIETCKRISDFILGAVYVMQGDVEKMSKRIFRFWTNK